LFTRNEYDLLLNLIKKKINTLSKLGTHIPFSVRELNKILKKLEELSGIGHVKKR
jgi:hypothetical protein